MAKEDRGDELFADGASFGLAFAVHWVSRYLDVPPRSSVAATATLVDATGRLEGVEHLREKIEVLHRWALGVDTLVVAEEDCLKARGIASECAPTLRVVGAEGLQDVLALAFEPGDLARGFHGDHARAAILIDGLFALTVRGYPGLLNWIAVADAAAAAAAILGDRPNDPLPAWQAQVAQAIARRHASDARPVPFNRELASRLPSWPLRIMLLAHAVQGVTDSGEDPDDVVAEAERRLREDEGREFEAHLWVLGALGRYHAAEGRWSHASIFLLRAVRGWKGLEALPEASRPLCELLRVLPLDRKRDPQSLDEVASLARACAAHKGTTPISRTFLALALGRAFATVGRAPEAARELADVSAPWDMAFDHVRASRLRWQARLLPAHEAELSRARLRELVGKNTNEAGFAAALSALDAALLAGGDGCAALAELERIEDARVQVERIRRRHATEGRALAEAVADEFPY